MKRLHVHVGVADLDQSIGFYSTLFGAEPSVRKNDYAKWMLDDPCVNFAISTHNGHVGLDHLGVQAESQAELGEIAGRLKAADHALLEQSDAACCYTRSDKAWAIDPTGLRWETFHTSGAITTYGEDGLAKTARAAAGAVTVTATATTRPTPASSCDTSACAAPPATTVASAPAKACC